MGTRYCHGKNHEPVIASKESDGYLCTSLFDMHNPRFGIKAWVFCIQGGERRLKDKVCYNEQCISQERVPDKTGHVSETPHLNANYPVHLTKHNECPVTATHCFCYCIRSHFFLSINTFQLNLFTTFDRNNCITQFL